MAYKRKTKDDYVVQGNYGYGHGFEDECTEETRKEAKARLRESIVRMHMGFTA